MWYCLFVCVFSGFWEGCPFYFAGMLFSGMWFQSCILRDNFQKCPRNDCTMTMRYHKIIDSFLGIWFIFWGYHLGFLERSIFGAFFFKSYPWPRVPGFFLMFENLIVPQCVFWGDIVLKFWSCFFPLIPDFLELHM